MCQSMRVLHICCWCSFFPLSFAFIFYFFLSFVHSIVVFVFGVRVGLLGSVVVHFPYRDIHSFVWFEVKKPQNCLE